ncbi:MAG: exonuclease SbcCD subunit D [Lachnospiraceae bacterium]|nr:exonuclease SbcCD subunit D [Lachnospiraceae bacterium]
MKLLHVGDLHLGRSLGDFDLRDDQEHMLNELLKIIDEKEADAILIAGDVYDKSLPSESATNLLDGFLRQLAKRRVFTYMISGNHDSDERLNYGSELFKTNRIFIAGKYEGELCRHTLEVGKEEADIYLLPFVKASQVRHYHPEADIKSYDDAVRTVISGVDIDKSRHNILVAHQFVVGENADPVLGGSETIGAQSVGLVEKIGYDSFDDFDYVALGHIHSPQQVGRETIRYSGSPLKYSLSEVNNEKSVTLITFEGEGKPEIELIPVRPKRDMRHIRGKMKDLLDNATSVMYEDYMYVTLTDDEIINDAMPVFQQVYPNTVKIDYDNEHTRQLEQVDISKIVENRSFEDLITDFYSQIYGTGISEEEMDIMREAAREAGVIHETD